MYKRKQIDPVMEQCQTKIKARKKYPRLSKLKNAPPVNKLQDLIELGKSIKFYKDLDMIMLWRVTPYLEELDKMIGMDSLKETIFEQVKYYLKGLHKKNKEGEYLHTAIYGAPGSGKTTVAKIIGKIYQSMGILSDNSIFKSLSRDDLVAGYLGQTAKKTKKALTECLGGIAFGDEIYAMGPRDKDKDSFAKEAIDVINAFLSEHKNDFCFIIAGYEKEVKTCFFSMNKGLERRFPWVHIIPEYTNENLGDIFVKMVKDINWDIAFEKKDLVALINENKDMFKFAGGDIETFVTKCKIAHSNRVFSLGKEHMFVLTRDDLVSAIKMIKKNSQNNDEESRSKYMMYT